MWCDIYLRNSEIELHAEGFNTLLIKGLLKATERWVI